MNQTEQNLTRLALLVRNDRKAFAQVCATAKALKLRSPKKAAAPKLSAEGLRRKAFAKNFSKRDLLENIALHGTRRVSNCLLTASILETAAHKFNAMKGQK